MQDYLLLSEKLKKTSEQLNQLSIGLIKSKQDVEEFLSQLENYRQIIEEENRNYLGAYERLTLRLVEILDDITSQKLKGVDTDTKFEEFIEARVKDALRRESLVLFNVEPGELFNPEKHEFIKSITKNEKPEGTILKILKPGYVQNSKIIRRAGVVITRREVDEI